MYYNGNKETEAALVTLSNIELTSTVHESSSWMRRRRQDEEE
jgi:hypothetical protein